MTAIRPHLAITRRLESFLDESTDEQQESVFTVGSFLIKAENLSKLQSAWVKCLSDNGIAYFRATSCKSVRGPFFKLRREHGTLDAAKSASEKIRSDLENILLASNQWTWSGLCIVTPDYDRVMRQYPAAGLFFDRDYSVAAYSQMFYSTAKLVRRRAADHKVGFIVDDSSSYWKIADAYMGVKANHPTVAKWMATIVAEDDKVTLPLQMADFMAGIVKDAFLEWSARGKMGGFPLVPKWSDRLAEPIGIWNEKYMLSIMRKSLKRKRLPALRPLRKMSKSGRKIMRKALTDKRETEIRNLSRLNK